ncbi:NTP transferase domain-containing protein [Chitinophaga sp. SYP-B3965]|uniref:mannose-1-phosphate guanylyltransferase n=1 Tax=Chitinophaga sp. SYP-B3965 TaxID=2663120 RepID=UPI001299B619|nr:sugar phosphate nucleotidyltransferase [Chitinophaga sp. SYP-B3965]MRG43868.1 NTP transferase domain-containing protein [Chitinophaga sp. SYP-B3965]
MHHILLCGGSGTRLWPLSNQQTPKQLLPLFEDRSLLQLTYQRNKIACTHIMAIMNAQQQNMIATQLQEAGAENPVLLAEPVGRNTAAAIALAAFVSASETVLLITPADHLIGTPDLYAQTIATARELAEADNVVTIGLQPNYPETGYGYIQYKGYDVLRFVEKPDLPTATLLLQSGDHLWNSGIFCCKAGVMLEELQQYAPAIYKAAAIAAEEWLQTGKLSQSTMEAIPSDSIDYAVMEKSKRVKVVPSYMQWSDVGSYEALSDALTNHYQYSNHQAVFINSNPQNSMVIGKEKLVALVGVENMVVVDTPGVLLIMQKGKGQEIKQLHQWVKENRPELL